MNLGLCALGIKGGGANSMSYIIIIEVEYTNVLFICYCCCCCFCFDELSINSNTKYMTFSTFHVLHKWWRVSGTQTHISILSFLKMYFNIFNIIFKKSSYCSSTDLGTFAQLAISSTNICIQCTFSAFFQT